MRGAHSVTASAKKMPLGLGFHETGRFSAPSLLWRSPPPSHAAVTHSVSSRWAGTRLHTATQGSRLGSASRCGCSVGDQWPPGLFLLGHFIRDIRHPSQRHMSLLLTAHQPE